MTLPPRVTAPLPTIESALSTALDAAIPAGRLRDACAHSLLGGGKRIRPLLAWHSAEAAGADGMEALPVCVAVEMVHTFSLVHDDLPAMDDDDLRRGRPTVHIAFDEATAILAGDALLALAPTLLSAINDAELARTLVSELSLATVAMVEGQMLDTVAPASGEPTLEHVRHIHSKKTGALIDFSTSAGAYCAGADRVTAERFAALGRELGLLFQIVDDLLDEEQTAEATGKRTGKDREAGKLTFPVVLGLEGARAEAARVAGVARELLGELGAEDSALADLVAWLEIRRH